MDEKPYDSPSDVCAEAGEVLVDGPGGVAVSLTPAAAAETSQRLLFGAAEAQGQKVDARKRKERGF